MYRENNLWLPLEKYVELGMNETKAFYDLWFLFFLGQKSNG
jgi:hypothetical protein